MWSQPRFLKLCEELHKRRESPALEEGMKIARGFADLGFEEFLLLPGKKLLSLYSGQVTQFPEEHAHFFFAVPDPDTLTDLIVRSGWDILTLEYRDQRSWVCLVQDPKSLSKMSFEGSTLEETLAHTLVGTIST